MNSYWMLSLPNRWVLPGCMHPDIDGSIGLEMLGMQTKKGEL